MNRTSLLAAAVSAALLATASPLAARSLAYEDNKLNFKNCKGEDVSARWFGGNLTLSQAGKSPAEPAPVVEYQTWDGGCGTFGWDGAIGALSIKEGDATTTRQAVYFVAWDGSLWAASRTGAGFYLARIADKGDPNPKANFQAAADRVVKSNFMSVPAAELLAKELSEAK
jgi:hypothetical protein